MNENLINEIKEIYNSQQKKIEERLELFKTVGEKGDDKRIFAELSFCLLTPQSKAKLCWSAVEKMVESDILYNGDREQIKNSLFGIRFPNNKSGYIIEARNLFTENGKLTIKKKIFGFKNNFETRDWLIKNVKGIGYKEAGHFLRNIGLGENLAILDRHILKNMLNIGIINEIPKTLTKKKYLEIEKIFWDFSEKISVPGLYLDMILWYKEAGEFFK